MKTRFIQIGQRTDEKTKMTYIVTRAVNGNEQPAPHDHTRENARRLRQMARNTKGEIV